jgi:hypothetical protein
MYLDQLLVTLCVVSAGSYLLRRQWNSLRRTRNMTACGGGCGCVKTLKTSPPPPPRTGRTFGTDYSSTRSSS